MHIWLDPEYPVCMPFGCYARVRGVLLREGIVGGYVYHCQQLGITIVVWFLWTIKHTNRSLDIQCNILGLTMPYHRRTQHNANIFYILYN